MAYSTSPRRKSTRPKPHARVATFLSRRGATGVAFSAAFVLSATVPSTFLAGARANGEKQVVHLRLSPSPDVRTRQLADLGALDVLGVDTAHGIVDVRASGPEISFLTSRGFEVSFAPPDTAGTLAFDIQQYLTPEKLALRLSALADAHPDLVRVWSLGKTHEGRDILAVEVTSRKGDANRKPAALFNAMHHARELMTTEVAVDIVETLVADHATDENTRRLLEDFRVIVVPQVNPDGNARVHASSRYWRKNAWRDGSRVVGVDLNRNYPALWNACQGSSGDKGSDSYRGPEPASEPETRAMMELVREVKPLVNISYHAYGELIIHPFGCRSEKNPSQALFASVGARMRAELVSDEGRKGTYAVGAAPDVIYPADGTDVDWQWKEEGVVSFAVEVGSSRQGFQPDYARWRDTAVANQRGGWKALLAAMADGTVVVKTEHLSAPVEATLRAVAPDGTRAALDADDATRRFPLRRTADGYAFLLPEGAHEITFRDGAGREETRFVPAH